MAKKRLRFHWVHLVCFFDHLLRSAKLHLWDRDAECQAALATPLACSTHLPHISVCLSFPLHRGVSWSSLGASETTRAVATVAGFSENNLHPQLTSSLEKQRCRKCLLSDLDKFFQVPKRTWNVCWNQSQPSKSCWVMHRLLLLCGERNALQTSPNTSLVLQL